jgi:hypothetical protein
MAVLIPPYLRDIFGEKQTIFEIVAILALGIILTGVLFLTFPEMAQDRSWWRGLLAFLLIADIFCGSVANFSRGTNTYYSKANGRTRLIFIAIHLHLLAIAWLLGTNLVLAIAAWGYTIAGALVVNALLGNRLQLFVAALLLVIGMFAIVVGSGFPLYFLVISLVFLVKVLFAFPVDHYQQQDGI